MENVNYLLLFNITVQESHQISNWSAFFARANSEAQKHRPKSTLMPSKKFDELQRGIKALEEGAGRRENFSNFIESQRREMQELQKAKMEKIKEDLRYLDEEKLKDPDVQKALCAEYKEFQITEDVIISLVQKVIKENKNNSSEEDFSNFLSKSEAKAIDTLIVDAGFGDASLYEILGVDSRTPLEDIKEAAKDRSNAETTKISLNHARQKLFGQCLKIFKTNESKIKYDNYLRISRYKKINSHIESPFKYTPGTSISETVASKIITQAIKDYPSISRAQAAEYIKKYCEYWGYEVSIAATEFIQVVPTPRPEANEEDKIAKLLQNAEDMYKKAKDYERSKKLYEEVINMAPTNPAAWFGMAFLITNDFSIYTGEKMREAQKYVTKALNVATGNDAVKFRSKWNAYTNTFNSKQNEYRRRINENDKQHDILSRRNKELSDIIRVYKNGKSNFFTMIFSLVKIAIAAIIALSLFVGIIALFGYIDESAIYNSIYDSLIYVIIMIFLPPVICFGIPILTFVILIKKFFKKKISKKTQKKIIASEKEFSENQITMEKLREENNRLQSYL